jgi:hypothetical protein
MKLKIFYYIDNTDDDSDENEEIEGIKKDILTSMNKFDEYIEKEEFNKLYLKHKAKILYKSQKNELQKKRKENLTYCEICNKEIQTNTYEKTHLNSKSHIKNLELNINKTNTNQEQF